MQDKPFWEQSYSDYEAVSYTHLEVYKRQGRSLPGSGRRKIRMRK